MRKCWRLSAPSRSRLGSNLVTRGNCMRALVVLTLLLTACHKEAPKVVVPEVFRVKFETTQGDFVVEANRSWSPHGVDRFHELIRMKFYDQSRFYRVLKGFIAQFGVHRDFKVQDVWRGLFIPDDPFQQKNLRGTLAFAK